MAVSFASRPMRARRNKREALCNRIVLPMDILDLLPAGGQDSEASRKESERERERERARERKRAGAKEIHLAPKPTSPLDGR